MGDDTPKRETLHYRRSHFVTRLPVDFFYTPSHCWLERRNEDGLWRIGLTKFATRMLGELVDFGFEEQPGASVKTGQIIGWVEGFKAISDIYCVIDGSFVGTNAGWLYEATGEPDVKLMNVEAYTAVLDKTIDKILENQRADEIE
jgi:glycine cleavage system H protein